MGRARRMAVGAAICFAMLVLLAGPARADHTCSSGNQGDCGNTAGVIGAAAGIATTIAVTTTLIRRRRAGSKDTDVCKELESQYQRLYETWKAQYDKARKALPTLQRAQASVAETERNRAALTEQQQGAAGYMLGAGGLAGATIGAMAGSFCGAMSRFWASAISMGEASAAVDAAVGAEAISAAEEAWLAAKEFALANAGKPSYWAGAARRLGAEAIGTGVAVGAAAGKALESAMDKGMQEVNQAAATQQQLVKEFEDTCLVLVHDANRSRRELEELAGRIDRECGVEMQKPEGGELSVPGHRGG